MPAKKATTTESKAKKPKAATTTEVVVTPAEVSTPKSVVELKAEYAKYVLDYRMNKQKDSSKLKKMRREVARALTKQNTKI